MKRRQDEDSASKRARTQSSTPTRAEFGTLHEEILNRIFSFIALRPRLLVIARINRRFRRVILDASSGGLFTDARVVRLFTNLTSLHCVCPLMGASETPLHLPRLTSLHLEVDSLRRCTCYMLTSLSNLTNIEIFGGTFSRPDGRDHPLISLIKSNAATLQSVSLRYQRSAYLSMRISVLLTHVHFPSLSVLRLATTDAPIYLDVLQKYATQLKDATIPYYQDIQLPILPNLTALNLFDRLPLTNPEACADLLRHVPKLEEIYLELPIHQAFEEPIVPSLLPHLRHCQCLPLPSDIRSICGGGAPRLTSIIAASAFWDELGDVTHSSQLSRLTSLRHVRDPFSGDFSPALFQRQLNACTSLKRLWLVLPFKLCKFRHTSLPNLEHIELDIASTCTLVQCTRLLQQLLTACPRLQSINVRSRIPDVDTPQKEQHVRALFQYAQQRGLHMLQFSAVSTTSIEVLRRLREGINWLSITLPLPLIPYAMPDDSSASSDHSDDSFSSSSQEMPNLHPFLFVQLG